MPVWVVSKAHIDALVSAALELDLSWYDEPEPEIYGPDKWRNLADARRASEVGIMLWAENVASVQFCYPATAEHDAGYPGPDGFSQVEVAAYRFERTEHLSPVVVLKALDCYEYVSSEYPGWRSCEARSFCTSLRDALVHRLPGYREAPWDLEEQDVRPGAHGALNSEVLSS